MKIEAISSPSDCEAFREEWEALHNNIRPQMPFSSPLWNLTWWKHYSKNSFAANYSFFMHTVRDAQGGLIAVVPWMITTRPGFGPLKIRTLNYFGADQSITEIRGVICKPENEAAVIAALLRYLREGNFQFDIIDWMYVGDPSAVETLEQKTPLSFCQINSIYILSLKTSWTALYSGLSSSTKKYMRRSYEKVAESKQEFKFSIVSDASEYPEAMARFFRLHTARASSIDMFAHPDKFNYEKNRQFIYDIFESLFSTRSAIIFELRLGDEVAACRLGFILGNSIYIYYSGYDPRWRNHSVGTVLMIEAVKWSISNNFTEFNLSAGKDRSKLRWKPREFIYQSGLQVRPDFRGSIISHCYQFFKKNGISRRKINKKIQPRPPHPNGAGRDRTE